MQELKAFGLLYQDQKDIMPQFIFRETSVQHFDTPLGMSLHLYFGHTTEELTMLFCKTRV